MSNLKPGSFYWVIPANDPDTDEEWENREQPARYVGEDENGEDLWICLPVGEPDTWPMIWVGDEIICPPHRGPK